MHYAEYITMYYITYIKLKTARMTMEIRKYSAAFLIYISRSIYLDAIVPLFFGYL